MKNLSIQHRAVNDWMQKENISFDVARQELRQIMEQPYDPIPRVLSAKDFTRLEQGLVQRINALNLFLNDIYRERMILRDGVIPEEYIYTSPDFHAQCMELIPPKKIYTHLTATDLVCTKDGTWYAMEDSLTAPDGITYPYFARKLCREAAPEEFQVPTLCDNCGVDILLKQLYHDIMDDDPDLEGGLVVMLAEDPDSPAAFELRYLAGLTGAVVASSAQLIVMDNRVYYRAPEGGFQKVSILHRLLPDRRLDPLCFDADALCGIPHLMEVYGAGRIAILNAPGCSVAEDRGLAALIPNMIRYYLDEEPILPNVPTYLPWYPDQRDYVLSHMDQLVFKEVGSERRTAAIYGSGLTPVQQESLRKKILSAPRRYIAQEVLEVEQLPVLSPEGTGSARCDLRAYTVHSDSLRVWMGGLTRFTVRSGDGSHMSGFKDTWVMSE